MLLMGTSKQDPRANFKPFQDSPERVFAPAYSTPNFGTALIFLDTNVLLAPYRTSTETLAAIKDAYGLLKREARLLVPGQVAREFARNRPSLVASVYKAISDQRGVSIGNSYDPPAILQNVEQNLKAKSELEKAKEALRKYRNALEELMATVRGWQHSDPVLEVYQVLALAVPEGNEPLGDAAP
jgi:predicted nucleic acid-binding protein